MNVLEQVDKQNKRFQVDGVRRVVRLPVLSDQTKSQLENVTGQGIQTSDPLINIPAVLEAQ